MAYRKICGILLSLFMFSGCKSAENSAVLPENPELKLALKTVLFSCSRLDGTFERCYSWEGNKATYSATLLSILNLVYALDGKEFPGEEALDAEVASLSSGKVKDQYWAYDVSQPWPYDQYYVGLFNALVTLACTTGEDIMSRCFKNMLSTTELDTLMGLVNHIHGYPAKFHNDYAAKNIALASEQLL